MVNLYRIILFLKLIAVLAYAGGVAGAFLATEPADRRRAIHALASPSLLAIWLTGYALTSQLGVPLTELWVLGALLLSLASLLGAIHSVARDRRTLGALAMSALPLAAVLGLMVFRPTWGRLRGAQ